MKKIKRISKDKKVQAVFSETAVMAILERMEDGIKLVAEGVTGVQRQLDEVKVDAYSFRHEMDIFRVETNARFEQIEANQKTTLEYLFNADEKFEAIEIELKEIRAELIALNDKILSPEEIKSFSKRISIVEKNMENFRVFMNSKARMKVA
jgi:hypothetical protein